MEVGGVGRGEVKLQRVMRTSLLRLTGRNISSAAHRPLAGSQVPLGGGGKVGDGCERIPG